jgi:tetratricopeptide (TPR) repeat protein
MRTGFRVMTMIAMVFLVVGPQAGLAGPIEEAEARAAQKDLDGAIEIMRQEVARDSMNAEALAYLGSYLVTSAGDQSDMMVAARLSNEAFQVLDRSLEIDPDGLHARFYRGVLGIHVPPFMGHQEEAIADLERIVEMAQAGPGTVKMEYAAPACWYLGQAYAKRGDEERAQQLWEALVARYPESEYAEKAREELASGEADDQQRPRPPTSQLEGKGGPATEWLRKGAQALERGDYAEASRMLEKAVEVDSTNVEAHRLLAFSYSMEAGQGYDEQIAEDTDFRIAQCAKALEQLDRMVALAPDDLEMRLERGIALTQMPSFLGRLDDGIADLEMVIEGSVPANSKARALYHLAAAYERKARGVRGTLLQQHRDSEPAQQALNEIAATLVPEGLPDVSGPAVTIEFVLGFHDELPPQSAVWVEDEKGRYVRTLYVSGFAGNVGERQVTLPEWTKASRFDTDGTTGASIDYGHHSLMWDLTDGSGRRVVDGRYTFRIEVQHWPTMERKSVSARLIVGEKPDTAVVKAGPVLPFARFQYLPSREERS